MDPRTLEHGFGMITLSPINLKAFWALLEAVGLYGPPKEA